MSQSLLPSRMLFRFSAPCRYRKPLWGDKGAQLGEEYRLLELEALEGRTCFADVRAAWSDEGLAFGVQVRGKRSAVRCHENRMDESDGLQVWIDTRDTHNIHRASRFCHRFAFLPSGGGRKRDQPLGDQLLINRARENPRPLRPEVFRVRREKRVDGYVLEAFIPADALTGYDPAQHARLGFTYLVQDHELGEQTFGVGGELPFREDPSLWATLDLVK